MLCCNLTRLDTNYLDQPGFPRYAQVIFTDVPDMHSAGNTRETSGRSINKQAPIPGNEFTILVHRLHLQGVEVIEYDEISNEVRRNCTTIAQAKILRSIIAC